MQDIKTTLNKNTSITSRFNITGTSNTSNDYNSSKYDYDCDKLYEELKDLCGDLRFRPYYVGAFYKLGNSKVLQLASIARADETNFGWLVKRALSGLNM